jgi:hypothetical protein
MRLTALLILFSQAIVRGKANIGSLATLPNFNKGVNWSASFVNIVATTVMFQPVFLSF